jgi:hypothetical protein
MRYRRVRDYTGVAAYIRWSTNLIEWYASGEGPAPRPIHEAVETNGLAHLDWIRASTEILPSDTTLFLQLVLEIDP